MPRFRKLARNSKMEPDKQEYRFDTDQKDPHPKPEAAKVKRRRLKMGGI